SWLRSLRFLCKRPCRRNTRCCSSFRPQLEAFEDRIVPSTRVWDGGGTSLFWSDRFNWVGDVAPVNGDDLVFPDRIAGGVDSTKRSSINNIGGWSVNSIVIRDSGYSLNSSVTATLGAGGILFDDPSDPGQSVINLALNVSPLDSIPVVRGAPAVLRING